jgi:non-ribosomal peptide synthetase component F
VADRLLPRDLASSLRTYARDHNATLFMTLLAAYQVLLARYSRSTDFCVGVPVAGRNRVEFEPLVGLFINTLPMRARLQDDPSFSDFLARVKQTCLDAFAHQDLPFEKMVESLHPERDLSRTPLFQVAFGLRNVPRSPLNFPIVELEFDSGIAPFDLNLDVTDTPEGLSCRLQYCTDLFEQETADGILRHFQSLLETVVADDSAPVSSIPLFSAEDTDRRPARQSPEPNRVEPFELQAEPAPRHSTALFPEEAPLGIPAARPLSVGAARTAGRLTPPQTSTQIRLAAIWRDLLGHEPAGIEQNFFEAGGHSLMAMRLASRMEREFGKPVPLRAIFENPTLERLASFLETSA